MYSVILIYPGHRVEIPCSSLSTAKIAWKKFLIEDDAKMDSLVRIKVLGPKAEVLMSIPAHRKSEVA